MSFLSCGEADAAFAGDGTTHQDGDADPTTTTRDDLRKSRRTTLGLPTLSKSLAAAEAGGVQAEHHGDAIVANVGKKRARRFVVLVIVL
jgi:phage FluMu gp28-like protein